MSTNAYIPEKLCVGFQDRDDTFSGKLSYVTYYDNKGVLRKEDSWQSWRDKKYEPLELDNIPSEGFVFNKGVQRWETDKEYVRVWDPRGYEIEITVSNVLDIVANCDISKREILTPCVLAWEGTRLLLIPTTSESYKQAVAATKSKTAVPVKTKDLKPGTVFTLRKGGSEDVVYLGKLPVADSIYGGPSRASALTKFLEAKVEGFQEQGMYPSYRARNYERNPYHRYFYIDVKHVFVKRSTIEKSPSERFRNKLQTFTTAQLGYAKEALSEGLYAPWVQAVLQSDFRGFTAEGFSSEVIPLPETSIQRILAAKGSEWGEDWYYTSNIDLALPDGSTIVLSAKRQYGVVDENRLEYIPQINYTKREELQVVNVLEGFAGGAVLELQQLPEAGGKAIYPQGEAIESQLSLPEGCSASPESLLRALAAKGAGYVIRKCGNNYINLQE